MVLGLARLTAGHATIGGHRYTELTDPARTVGANLEVAGAHPGRAGRNHLRALAAMAGLPDSRVEEVLRMVELDTAADRRAASTRSACASGSGSRPRCSATRACSSSTSPPTASTRRASAGCATSCAGWRRRAAPCSSPATSDYVKIGAGGLLAAAIGVGVGTLVRNQVAAVIGILVWLSIIEPLTGEIDGSWVKYTLGSTLNRVGLGGNDEMSFGTSILLLAVWAAVLCAAGALLDRRRDVE